MEDEEFKFSTLYFDKIASMYSHQLIYISVKLVRKNKISGYKVVN